VDGGELARVGLGGQVEIDEAGAGDLGARHERTRRQRRDDRLGERARVLPGALGQAQRDVGGELSVGRLAGALERHRLRRRHLGQEAAGELT